MAVKKAREQWLAISDKTVKKAKKILEVAKEDPEIASLFSVSTRTIENWTRDLREKEKEELERSIFDLWLSCWSYKEIEEKLSIDDKTAERIVKSQMRKISQMTIEPPESLRIYDVWNFSKCDERKIEREGKEEARTYKTCRKRRSEERCYGGFKFESTKNKIQQIKKIFLCQYLATRNRRLRSRVEVFLSHIVTCDIFVIFAIIVTE